MKLDLYPRLAVDGMVKNRRVYLPYLLACTGTVMLYYILLFLRYSPAVNELAGGSTVQEVLRMGGGVMAVFSFLFLFYTHAFLMRRRKREFGLYNILGMGKIHLGWIMVWETFTVALLTLSVGLLAGIAFSKLAELALINIMKGDVAYSFTIQPEAVIQTLTVFLAIFVLLLLNALRQVWFSTAIRLMRSENEGERPPKANWLLGVAGFLILAAAYYLAVTTKNPITALVTLFVAVLMVIIATYCIMISGSVLLCRILQHNRRFYYNPKHFVSVSSMLYRMKRNGAGLASICILATMVLVTVSSTCSLYLGGEDSLKSRYPRELNIRTVLGETDPEWSRSQIWTLIDSTLEECGAEESNMFDYFFESYVCSISNGIAQATPDDFNLDMEHMNALYMVYLVGLSDYNAMMGTQEILADGEALLYCYRCSYGQDTLSFQTGASFHVRKLHDFPGNGESAMDMMPSFFLVIPELTPETAQEIFGLQGDEAPELKWNCGFDTTLEPEQQINLRLRLRDVLKGPDAEQDYGIVSATVESREQNRSDFFSLYGGILFLGVLLSSVFLAAAVLIIYYKQITEGYEDQARFAIMRKVGMTRKEIRRSINSQLLTVFYLPLIMAVIHLTFAFPIISQLLQAFSLNNKRLLAIITAVCALVFALFYAVVYKLTSNAYYRIVTDLNND